MRLHSALNPSQLKELISSGQIQLGGNAKLKIYGRLTCNSGKRMKKENRVFFHDETEAIRNGYRPCGHCMRNQYLQWKSGKNQVESRPPSHQF